MSLGKGLVLFERKSSADAAFIRHSHGKQELTGGVTVSRGWSLSAQDKVCRRVVVLGAGNLESTVVVKNVEVFGSEECILDYFMQLGEILEFHVLWAVKNGSGEHFC